MRFQRWVLLLAISSGLLFTEEPEEHVIYVIRRPAVPTSETMVVTQPTPARGPTPERTVDRDGLYDAFWNDPNQFYIDSPEGPLPLWGFDLVYDATGRPHPRYPDPFTKAVIENPDDYDAYKRRAAWMQVLLRRAQITGDRLKESAILRGELTADVLRVPQESNQFANALGVTKAVDPTTLGTPAFKPEQARELGLKPAEIPRTPGQPNDVEVYWVWDPACSFCDKMARDWFYFAADVAQAGYKAVSVTNSPDTANGYSKLQFWGIRWPTQQVANIYDWTDLIGQMKIDATPTVIMINRRTAALKRFDELMTEEELRSNFLALIQAPPGEWPPPANQAKQAEREGIRLEGEAARAAGTPADKPAEDPHRQRTPLPARK